MTGRSCTTPAPATQINTIADSGPVTYAGWCGNGCNPGGAAPFTSGIDTNFGGTWHTVTSKVLPNRVPTSFTIDPANSAHAVVTFGGFSRHWIPNAGVGHVFVTLNGGKTWTNVSGNLPDAPANSSVIWRGKLVVSTDVGIFATSFAGPGNWVRVGTGQPGRSLGRPQRLPGPAATCWSPRTARACGRSADITDKALMAGANRPGHQRSSLATSKSAATTATP